MYLQFLPLSTPAGTQEVMGFTLPELQQHVHLEEEYNDQLVKIQRHISHTV